MSFVFSEEQNTHDIHFLNKHVKSSGQLVLSCEKVNYSTSQQAWDVGFNVIAHCNQI